VSGKVVGDAKQVTTCGGRVEVAGVVRSENERTGREGVGSRGTEGVEKLKKVSEKRRTRWNQKGQTFTGRWVQDAVGCGLLGR